MKILILIFVLLISFNLKAAQYLHCEELHNVEGSSVWSPNLNHFYIFEIGPKFISTYKFRYRPEYKSKYPDSITESFLSEEFDSPLFPKEDLLNLMSKPIYQSFRIIKKNKVLINSINTSINNNLDRGTWLNLNLISGYGIIDRKRIWCELVSENIIQDYEFPDN